MAALALVLGDELDADGRLVEAHERWREARRLLAGDSGTELQSLVILAQLHLRFGEIQAAARLADSLSAGPLRHPLVHDLFKRLGRSLPN